MPGVVKMEISQNLLMRIIFPRKKYAPVCKEVEMASAATKPANEPLTNR